MTAEQNAAPSLLEAGDLEWIENQRRQIYDVRRSKVSAAHNARIDRILSSLRVQGSSSLPPIAQPDTAAPGSYWLFQKSREHTDAGEWRALVADANRYRFLREFYGSHIGMTEAQPAECGVYWEWQQATPDERYWSIDNAVDADLRRRARHEAEEWAEANAPPPRGYT